MGAGESRKNKRSFDHLEPCAIFNIEDTALKIALTWHPGGRDACSKLLDLNVVSLYSSL